VTRQLRLRGERAVWRTLVFEGQLENPDCTVASIRFKI